MLGLCSSHGPTAAYQPCDLHHHWRRQCPCITIRVDPCRFADFSDCLCGLQAASHAVLGVASLYSINSSGFCYNNGYNNVGCYNVGQLNAGNRNNGIGISANYESGEFACIGYCEATLT